MTIRRQSPILCRNNKGCHKKNKKNKKNKKKKNNQNISYLQYDTQPPPPPLTRRPIRRRSYRHGATFWIVPVLFQLVVQPGRAVVIPRVKHGVGTFDHGALSGQQTPTCMQLLHGGFVVLHQLVGQRVVLVESTVGHRADATRIRVVKDIVGTQHVHRFPFRFHTFVFADRRATRPITRVLGKEGKEGNVETIGRKQ